MTAETGEKLIKELAPLVKDANCDVALCVPAILIPAMTQAAKGTNIKIGAENVHWAKSGAYTGEISVDMLKEYGVEYVIIGHSERRQYFGETDETVNKRTLAALSAGLTPIVCVGELLEERENGSTENVLTRQLTEGLKGVEDIRNVFLFHPLPGVLHGIPDAHPVQRHPLTADGQGDGTFLGIFHRIVQQIDQHLLDAHLIAAEHAGHGRIHMQLEFQPLFLCLDPDHVHDIRKKLPRLVGCVHDLHLAGLDF